ncbi:MAG: DUF1223 domain-containing protein [Bdellovibrionales bacterium]|nr:DUF1223 domain-containing protein [Bdellovibrionales bacterium]
MSWTHFKRKLKILSLLLLFLCISGFASADIHFESGVRQVHLLELFSTQSCSSCPAAQAWVSKLYNHSKLYKSFIPVVYHVDYWDYLGWKDPYSKPEYTQLQRNYAQSWNSRSIYTPMFVFDGKENRRRSLSLLSEASSSVGSLSASCDSNNQCLVRFQPLRRSQQKVRLVVVLLANRVSTKVTSGENSGLTLAHDFLVIDKKEFSFPHHKGSYQSRISLKEFLKQKTPDSSLAFWVYAKDDLRPIQVVGGSI